MKTNRAAFRPSVLCGALLCAALVCDRSARAHQFLQGRMETIVYRDKITVWASVPVEEVVTQLMLPVDDGGVVKTQADAYRDHGKYLLKHFFVSADDKLLTGKVASVQEPENKTFVPGDPSKEYVTYELEFVTASPPKSIALRQNILQEIDYTPGVPWQMTFIAGIRQDQKAGRENLLFDSTIKLTFTCDWSEEVAPAKTVPVSTAVPAHKPPESLKQPIREPNDNSRILLVAGIATGIAIVGVLALLMRLWKKRTG